MIFDRKKDEETPFPLQYNLDEVELQQIDISTNFVM